MTPKGNRTERRGHRPKLGKGETIAKIVMFPREMIIQLERKIGKKPGAFSSLVRRLVEEFLSKK